MDKKKPIQKWKFQECFSSKIKKKISEMRQSVTLLKDAELF